MKKQSARLNVNDLIGRATVTVPEAGQVLGIGRGAAYEAVNTGEIPSLRIGKRILVPVAKLLDMLGVVQS